VCSELQLENIAPPAQTCEEARSDCAIRLLLTAPVAAIGNGHLKKRWIIQTRQAFGR